MPVDEDAVDSGFDRHRLSWAEFDELAHGDGGAEVVRRLRQAERSRRMLLLRAIVDEVGKNPDWTGPLPSPDDAWDLLAKVESRAPAVLQKILAHPYLGSWAGYTTRLIHNGISGVCPLWVHVGHLHALAAAAAIHAGLRFDAVIPVWHGNAMLPTLGMARLGTDAPYAIAEVRCDGARVTIGDGTSRVDLPCPPTADAPGWWSVRRLRMCSGRHRLTVRLDDLDPYRGLYEPIPPQRLDAVEAGTWSALLDDAWRLIVTHVPSVAPALAAALDTVMPRRAVLFRTPSASTGEAFGSAIIALPPDAATLAATLIHEFQHIRLGGLLHLTPLYVDDPSERFYTAWRDDPRPIGGVLQGVYAFLGVTAFWRALTVDSAARNRRAAFEFAYWRGQTWRTLLSLRGDHSLTEAGSRFVAGMAATLGPWLDEPVPSDLADLATAAMADHYAGWRLRYLRPRRPAVTALTNAWLAGESRLLVRQASSVDDLPTPVPDGSWSHARDDLVRHLLGTPVSTDAPRAVPTPTAISSAKTVVPAATAADLAYASSRFTDATRGYRAELAASPELPAAWVGLGLSLAETGAHRAARTLLSQPELVRAVYREISARTGSAPRPDDLAGWIGGVIN
jgi:HEXXH motif-containing protein